MAGNWLPGDGAPRPALTTKCLWTNNTQTQRAYLFSGPCVVLPAISQGQYRFGGRDGEQKGTIAVYDVQTFYVNDVRPGSTIENRREARARACEAPASTIGESGLLKIWFLSDALRSSIWTWSVAHLTRTDFAKVLLKSAHQHRAVYVRMALALKLADAARRQESEPLASRFPLDLRTYFAASILNARSSTSSRREATPASVRNTGMVGRTPTP
jgi:hypothetical protein